MDRISFYECVCNLKAIQFPSFILIYGSAMIINDPGALAVICFNIKFGTRLWAVPFYTGGPVSAYYIKTIDCFLLQNQTHCKTNAIISC